MHCLLKETFGELAPKPFRLIAPRAGSRGCLYGYGRALADGLRDAAHTFADPQQLRALPPSSIDSKPMPSEWQSGKRLGFELRVRPVLRKSGGSARPGSEQDVFQVKAETFPPREMPHSREEVYADWLSGKLNGNQGVSLELSRTKLVSFQRTRSIRKLHSRYVEGPDAVDARRPLHNRPGCFRPAAGPGSGPAPVLRLRDAAAPATGQTHRTMIRGCWGQAP